MCLNNETWSLFYIITDIYNSVGTITLAFTNGEATTTVDRFVKWNCDNHMGVPVLAAFSATIRAFSFPLSQI